MKKQPSYKDKQKTKRQIMIDLEKKAIAARDKAVKKAKKELYGGPKIPGVNRSTLRRWMKQHRKVLKVSTQNEKTKD